MLVPELYAEIKAYNQKLALYPEVRKKKADGTILYNIIEPMDGQLILWPLKRALSKIWIG